MWSRCPAFASWAVPPGFNKGSTPYGEPWIYKCRNVLLVATAGMNTGTNKIQHKKNKPFYLFIWI